jgi:two-component system, OmpR family, phosphate regulon sensor histidine kinase PhoR
MAFFKRAVSLQEAVAVIVEAMSVDTGAPLSLDLRDLSLSLRRREPAPPFRVAGEAPAQSLLDAFPEAAAILEPGCGFVASNSRLDALLEGRTVGRTVLQATRSGELDDLATGAVAGRAGRREVTVPALGSMTVEAVAAPLPEDRALLVVRDLSAQKRAETVRRDFIANASHELRTPVAAISAATEMLLGMQVDEGARSFLEMIARQAARLSRLTSDLLDLSRLESGQWPVALGCYKALPICDAALEFVKQRAAARKIHLGEDVPRSLAIRADARATEQILVNLLDNAIKYTPEGGRVTLLADAAGPQVMVSVLDTGPGIELRHQQRIFERFYRVDGGRARADGGSGLGLAIVKHLAHTQGGEVGVESGRGGSRFWVKLPVAP